MSAKGRAKPKPLPEGWERSEEFSWNGRRIAPGTELKIRGVRGRWRFLSHTRTDEGVEWIDVVGGTRGCVHWRSFRPDRIRTVHRTRLTMTVQEARELVNRKNRSRREERDPKEVQA
jgi:hypothetical protein